MMNRDVLAGLLLIVLTVALYLPATQYGFVWDDEHYVEYNPTLRSVEGLGAIWTEPGAIPQYYPLVHTTYWVEYQLWELDARGYHTVNILLHALAALLLWRVLHFLALPGAWFAAAIFALHPVNVESAAWITERKNTLALCLYLASALAYLRHALPPAPESSSVAKAPGHFPRLYVLSFVLFLGALFSKTVACSLPASLLLVLWWKRGALERRWWLELAPFFVVGLALGLVTVAVEKNQVGASGLDWELSFVERCLIAGRALWFYAGKLLWPHDLSFFYPRWTIDASAASQYLYPLAAVAVAAAAWLGRARMGRGPLVALLIFGGTLLPALGFFDVYPMRFSFVADHFQYLAAPAFIALVVGGGTTLARRFGAAGTRAGGALGVVVLVVLALLTSRQLPQFRNLDSLWRTTLARNPEAWAAAHNLAMDLEEAGETEEAIALFQRALQIRPGYEEASNALAIAYANRGRHGEAIAQYYETLGMNPDNLTALSNLARLRATAREPDLRDLAEAERLAEHARAVSSDDEARVLAVLAEVYYEQGRLDEAIAMAREAIAAAVRAGDPNLARHSEDRLTFFQLLQGDERGSASP